MNMYINYNKVLKKERQRKKQTKKTPNPEYKLNWAASISFQYLFLHYKNCYRGSSQTGQQHIQSSHVRPDTMDVLHAHLRVSGLLSEQASDHLSGQWKTTTA